MNKWSSAFELFFLGSALFFVTALLEDYLYFSGFGIPILNYLDFGETILHFFQNLYIALVIIGGAFFPLLWAARRWEETSGSELALTYRRFFSGGWPGLLSLAGFQILLLSYYFWNPNFLFHEFLLLAIIWNLTFFSGSYWFLRSPLPLQRTSTRQTALIVLCLFTLVAVSRAGNQYWLNQFHKTSNFKSAEVLLNNGDQLQEDRGTIYIGRTKNYLFFQNRKTEEQYIDIIPVFRVKQFSNKVILTEELTTFANHKEDLQPKEDIPHQPILEKEKRVPAAPRLKKNEYRIAKSTSFRKLPNSRCRSWRRFQQDEIVTVIDSTLNNWWEVSDSKRTGWVKKSALAK